MATSPDIHDRGAAIFGSGADGVYWPYDASGIDRTLQRTDPERFQQQLADLHKRREVIVGWAERYGLKGSSVQCCPWWLTRKVSRRCPDGQCTHYGSGPDLDSLWLDHTICWLKDSRPAVITSAPYHVDPESSARVAWWLEQQPNLRSVQGEGWYGFGTTQIIMWRVDRIATVEPAVGAP
ncbi:hypothetical protein ACIQVK_21350 [Streptomyces sp. NPDC090493]|uniref:hypothetical protein n=1 Tax=Streptomyces sp. NPDC090493 TaxID=3365964 RepID=UPI0037F611E6